MIQPSTRPPAAATVWGIEGKVATGREAFLQGGPPASQKRRSNSHDHRARNS
ncbi:unnamed protein product [marine sediment metagenome]|uniref:Uncharacterized protein n=1 Tax=marine sediment metagenome TaxID=412755 RepID=X0UKE1_9ZZZZ